MQQIPRDNNIYLQVPSRRQMAKTLKNMRSNKVGVAPSLVSQPSSQKNSRHRLSVQLSEEPSTSAGPTTSHQFHSQTATASIIIDECSVADPESLQSEAAFYADKRDRKVFRNAYVTEIGDSKRLISLRELLDVIICAGKDTTYDELSTTWPFGGEDKPEISYEEAFYVYQKVSSAEITQSSFLQAVLNLEDAENSPDYSKIIGMVEKTKIESAHEKEELLRLLRKWKAQKLKFKELIAQMNTVRQELHSVNDEIVKKQRAEDSTLLLNSSTESLSSVFSSTRNQIPVGDSQTPICRGFFRDLRTEKMTVKSLVIQKSSELMTSIGYTFHVPKPVQISIGFRINEQIDADLTRFHSSLVGYIIGLAAHGSNIMAMTRKREGHTIRTDWMNYPAGNYTFCIRFIRPLRVAEPQSDALIIDEKNQLTKEFKVMLMNTFDIFDLDNDGLLTKEEIETYRILCGLGSLSADEWDKIKRLYNTRNEGLTINGFIKMHQMEIATYNSRQTFDMRLRLRELGYNRKFFLSTACPLLIDIHIGDGAIQLENFEISYYTPESDRRLLEYYWENGTALPYMKECQTLRMFKADHFAVIVAKNDEKIHYKLDLTSSNNVNIDREGLLIDVEVPANQLQQLATAISQAENWFLCVKKISIEPVAEISPESSPITSPTYKKSKDEKSL